MDDDLPNTRFVHPCNCTLIAHELCLLTWIASQQQTKGDRDPGASHFGFFSTSGSSTETELLVYDSALSAVQGRVPR